MHNYCLLLKDKSYIKAIEHQCLVFGHTVNKQEWICVLHCNAATV